MSLRERTRELVQGRRFEELDALVEEDPRSIRYLLAMSYQTDDELREAACRGIALAGRHHPKRVKRLVRQLVWAMNDESGTNALTAPRVIVAIADEQPELLLPMVPDLTRLAADPGLYEGLAEALRMVSERCPGEVGERIGASLRKQYKKGKSRGTG